MAIWSPNIFPAKSNNQTSTARLMEWSNSWIDEPSCKFELFFLRFFGRWSGLSGQLSLTSFIVLVNRQEYTSRNSQSWKSASSKHVSSGSFGEDNSKGTSTSGRQGGNSMTRVNAQAIASSEEEFFPKGGSAQSQIIPLQYVGSKDSERRQPDSDVLSDLAETIGELFDVLW